jgi:hypothetical protein
MNILEFAPLILAFLALCGVIGGFFAMKTGYFQQSGAAQGRAIDAQTAQIESLEAQIVTLKESLRHLKQVVITIQRLEEKRGVAIDINGEFVTLIDDGDKRERTLRIRIEPEPVEDANT